MWLVAFQMVFFVVLWLCFEKFTLVSLIANKSISVNPAPASWPCNRMFVQGRVLRWALQLVQCPVIIVLKSFTIFEQGASHFHFAWGLQLGSWSWLKCIVHKACVLGDRRSSGLDCL